MTCSNPECTSDKPVFARGLCQGCYYRQRRRGVLGRKYQPGGATGTCRTEGCDRKAHAAGLCSRHYQRSLDPMRNVWKVLRHRAEAGYPAAWDDFEVFMSDVGERPSDRHQLRRLRSEEPWSLDNLVWQEPVLRNAINGATSDMSHYHWARNLRVKYGLTPEMAQQIIDHQMGNCRICAEPLGYFGPTGRKEADVVVEHDHFVSGVSKVYAVRGIVHRVCNSGMGQLGDNIDNLRRAIGLLADHDNRKAAGLSIIDEINRGEE